MKKKRAIAMKLSHNKRELEGSSPSVYRFSFFNKNIHLHKKLCVTQMLFAKFSEKNCTNGDYVETGLSAKALLKSGYAIIKFKLAFEPEAFKPI